LVHARAIGGVRIGPGSEIPCEQGKQQGIPQISDHVGDADVNLRSDSTALDANSRSIRNSEFTCRIRESLRPNRDFSGFAVRPRHARRRAGCLVYGTGKSQMGLLRQNGGTERGRPARTYFRLARRPRACPVGSTEDDWVCSAKTAADGLRHNFVDLAGKIWVRFAKTVGLRRQRRPGVAGNGNEFAVADRLRPAAEV
jgi:hypothetical protein